MCSEENTAHVGETALQAYTSQFAALVMFGLVMCEDRISMQGRRREIIQGMRKLPGLYRYLFVTYCAVCHLWLRLVLLIACYDIVIIINEVYLFICYTMSSECPNSWFRLVNLQF